MPNTHTTLTSLFSDIADSIRAKTGSSAEIVADTFPTAIANIPSGTTEVEPKDINFYDYDGTLVESWTLAELANKTALPSNPDRTSEGLTADGWNWTLADLKTQNTLMDVGQMYHPTDGALHIFIELQEGRLSPYLGIGLNGSATIDWGDGNTDSISGSNLNTVVNTQHTYSAAGAYEVRVIPASGVTLNVIGNGTYGAQLLWSNSTTTAENRVYQNAINKVYLPTVGSMGTYAFYQCYSVQHIVIPSGTTMAASPFYNCYALIAMVIPSGLSDLPNNTFYANYSLQRVCVPKSVTSTGTNTFYNCYTLKRIALPATLTTIGNTAFTNCYSLKEVASNGITSFGTSTFMSNYALRKVTISSGTTAISSQMFNNCYSLANITIPSTVTSMASAAFRTASGLGEIHFKPSTPPTAADNLVFNAIPTSCIIYVPTGKLNDYKTANNYPNPNTYTYLEE